MLTIASEKIYCSASRRTHSATPATAARLQLSDLAAVISPMQERLPLPRAAGQVSRLAVPLDLPDMPADGFPSLDLPPVFGRHAAAHIVAAIPLEPAARIIGVKPSLATPDRERLAGVDAEEIERAVAPARREPGAREPALGKLLPGIRHVLAAEHAEAEHLLRRELRLELRIEIAADRRRSHVAEPLLHLVVHNDGAL